MKKNYICSKPTKNINIANRIVYIAKNQVARINVNGISLCRQYHIIYHKNKFSYFCLIRIYEALQYQIKVFVKII